METIGKIKEEDLFNPVKDWLEGKGYEIYSEVEVYGGRADIVGRNKPITCIVELKTSLTMDLIEQAVDRTELAHYVYIAIPKRKSLVHKFVKKVLKSYRIGLLEVDFDDFKNEYDSNLYYVRCQIAARYNRPKYYTKNSWLNKSWDDVLKPEHKTWLKGGSNGGGYVTPYKLTINMVKEYLKRSTYRFYRGEKLPDNNDGWRSINEILDHCETHYAAPKPSLSKSLRDFEYEWCEAKKEKGRLYFRYKEVN